MRFFFMFLNFSLLKLNQADLKRIVRKNSSLLRYEKVRMCFAALRSILKPHRSETDCFRCWDGFGRVYPVQVQQEEAGRAGQPIKPGHPLHHQNRPVIDFIEKNLYIFLVVASGE